eukprot:6885371-Pyramimonas_sp.AAC.1
MSSACTIELDRCGTIFCASKTASRATNVQLRMFRGVAMSALRCINIERMNGTAVPLQPQGPCVGTYAR